MEKVIHESGNSGILHGLCLDQSDPDFVKQR